MKKFTRIILWSEEDSCWVVKVPELPGCQADGRTVEDAIKNSEIIISEWIETAEALGRKIPDACHAEGILSQA